MFREKAKAFFTELTESVQDEFDHCSLLKHAAAKSEMTYIVSRGALNSTNSTAAKCTTICYLHSDPE